MMDFFWYRPTQRSAYGTSIATFKSYDDLLLQFICLKFAKNVMDKCFDEHILKNTLKVLKNKKKKKYLY